MEWISGHVHLQCTCLTHRCHIYNNCSATIKSRDITLLTKVCIVKAKVFPVVMYRYESWTTKKAEYWRIDAFELWCWRIFLRALWTASRSNPSILKKINPEYSLERLNLKLQYFGHLMLRADSLKKTQRIEGKRRRRWQRMRGLDSITNSMDMNLSKLWKIVEYSLACCSPWCHKESDTS